MPKNALVFTLVAVCAACGDSGGARVVETAPEEQAALDAGSEPESRDANAAAPAAPEASTSALPNDASSAADAGDEAPADGSSEEGQSDAAARPPLVLEIPVASVPCGESTCETTSNKVCCEAWSKGSGFAAERSCMPLSDCDFWHARSGDQNRAVPQECDGKEDCSGGQVCCMYAYGAPLCELGDIGDCIKKITGPGSAGICADNDKCMLGAMQFIGAGVPLGVLACNDDDDCADRPDTRCLPEEDDSLTTGAGVRARSYVKVCR